MSLRPMLWALEEAQVEDPTSALILIALADRANDDGTGAYPAQDWIATRARVGVATVKRRLKDLESQGLIRRGDQELVSHFRRDRRPVVWDLIMDARQLTSEPPLNLSDGSTSSERQLTGELQTVPSIPNGIETHQEGAVATTTDPLSDAALDEIFEKAWPYWPKDVKKKPARMKFRTKAREHFRADPVTLGRRIVAFGNAYRVHKPTPDESISYTPALEVWLNQERWGESLPRSANQLGPKEDPKTGYLVER